MNNLQHNKSCLKIENISIENLTIINNPDAGELKRSSESQTQQNKSDNDITCSFLRKIFSAIKLTRKCCRGTPILH